MIKIGLTDYAPEDKIIDILDANGIVKAKYVIDAGDTLNHTLMGNHFIGFSFKLGYFAAFRRTDYIMWEGIKYTLRNDYRPVETNTLNFEYTLRFEAPEMLLQDAQMFYTRQDLKEGEWSMTGSAASFINIAVINANRYFNTTEWQVGTVEPATIEYISFNATNVFDALTQIAETFGAEWYVTGKTIHLVDKVQFGTEVEFENEVSVLSMSQSEGDAESGFTRIVALGSTRNIAPNYRETEAGEAVDAIYQKRLRIPIEKGSTIDAWENMKPLEAVETTVIFDEVYPKRIGTMSDITTKEYTDTNTDTGEVTTWNAFRYRDEGLTFSKDYILEGVELKIVFQSGNLNGLDFAVKFNPEGLPETDPAAQRFEIIRNTDFGRPLPDETLKPQDGDTYILYGFNIQMVADQYVPLAEQELYEKGVAWVAANLKDKTVYTCPTVIQHFYDNEMDLTIGQKIKLINPRFDDGFRLSRIMGFEKKLINPYDAVYTVGDNAAYTWRNEVDRNIQELQYAGQVFQNTGGGSVYLIKQFDNTPPSEFNAYSATASNARYLNRQTGGTVQGDVRVLGSTISDVFGNNTFTSGQFGSGFKIWKAADGQSYAELDNLLVRREMQVNTLNIAEIRSVGGQILVSVANMTISAVTDEGDNYRCYFDNADGTIPNYFALNDQAICRRWNGTDIKYYWSLVTAIGLDYIDLSKTDKDGSGIPSPGDEVIQLGNRTRSDRQSAIVISAYGSDAPSIKQYGGINSYDLTGTEKTVISPNGNKLTGKLTIEPGSSGYENISGLPERFDGLHAGAVNLLRNSGFTGNFESKELTPDTQLTPDTPLFSPNLIYWDGQATVNTDENSRSGFSVTLANQTISQPIALIPDEHYIVSFKAKGSTIAVSAGGYTQSVALMPEYQRYTIKFTAITEGVFSLTGQCTVCEPQLERGTIPGDWNTSPLDNNPALEAFEAIRHITDSLHYATTTFNGGVIMSAIMMLGNFLNGQMNEVTAGMSGVYNTDHDVAFWAGGTLEKAIRTVANPFSKSSTAHAVITHGGQIVANEAIIRGTIFAEDGEFTGKITAKSGTMGGFNINEGSIESQALGDDLFKTPLIRLDGKNGTGGIRFGGTGGYNYSSFDGNGFTSGYSRFYGTGSNSYLIDKKTIINPGEIAVSAKNDQVVGYSHSFHVNADDSYLTIELEGHELIKNGLSSGAASKGVVYEDENGFLKLKRN